VGDINRPRQLTEYAFLTSHVRHHGPETRDMAVRDAVYLAIQPRQVGSEMTSRAVTIYPPHSTDRAFRLV
jgi:hypothetical protein